MYATDAADVTKKVKSNICYSASYMRRTRGQKRFDNLGSGS